MKVDFEGLNERDWLLQKASQSNGQIKYWIHANVVSVGDQQVKDNEGVWFQIIQNLEADEEIELLYERLGSLTYTLV